MTRVVAKMKQRHLITDEGFLRRLAVNLALMSGLIVVVYAVPNLHARAIDLYFSMKHELLRICSENMWWSMLALLSSSCCALQMILVSLALCVVAVHGFCTCPLTSSAPSRML